MRARQKKPNSYIELLKVLILCGLLILYMMFSGVFLFLPPLIGVLFIIFMDMYARNNLGVIVGLVVCLAVFEALNQLPIGILALVFLVMRYVITKKFNVFFGNSVFFVFWYVGSVYLVYFLSIYVIKMFGSGLGFELRVIFIYYFIVESLIGLFYEKMKARFKDDYAQS